MDTLKPGSKVLYKHARCACVGGGYTENYGIITDILHPPTGVWYKVSTDHVGTFVVQAKDIIKVI